VARKIINSEVSGREYPRNTHNNYDRNEKENPAIGLLRVFNRVHLISTHADMLT